MAETTATRETIIEQVKALPLDWHGSGSMNPAVFDGIGRHCGSLDIRHSVETGAGKTTLILSHLSQQHTVFALDHGQSLTRVRESPLCNTASMTFVEGPTQATLPAHAFEHKLQLALIDGPHSYPFAELEYYYIYPHLEPGAVLIVDDIDIRSVHNMYEFLKADDMFEELEVVATTAFFRRTDAPTFDPLGENWPSQKYNAKKLNIDKSAAGLVERYVPRWVKRSVPASLRNAVWRLLTRS